MALSPPDVVTLAESSAISPAAARSRVWQLFSIVFTHPVAELHERLASGVLQDTLAGALLALYGEHQELPAVSAPFSAFEAGYIKLYANGGNKGKAMAPLCAGDYAALRDGQTRPELLLKYLRFYKHFGLRVQPDPAVAELPDHLVCQLECLAWLAHLEADAEAGARSPHDYRLAQHDFTRHLLRPFLEQLHARHRRIGENSGAGVFFCRMVAALAQFEQRNSQEFAALTEAGSADGAAVKTAPAQGLWS